MRKPRIHRAGPLAWLLGWTLLVSGCGPGVGGTGAVADAGYLDAFGATAAPVCGTPLADRLDCAPATTIGDAASAGTAPTRYLDSRLGANLLVVFSDNSVQVVARCQQLEFAGTWGRANGSDQRFYGSSLVAGQLSRSLATLTVQPSAGGTLSAVLRNAEGQIVLGPLDLVPAPLLAPEPPACGGVQDDTGLTVNSFASIPGNFYGAWPERVYVIRTADEWAAAWASHDPMQTPVPDRPLIDFGSSMVVGISLGWGADTCHGVRVVRVVEEPNAVRVEYVVTTKPPPDSACGQSLVPMIALVRIRQTPKPVSLVSVVG